jgi:hypothetical protein
MDRKALMRAVFAPVGFPLAVCVVVYVLFINRGRGEQSIFQLTRTRATAPLLKIWVVVLRYAKGQF